MALTPQEAFLWNSLGQMFSGQVPPAAQPSATPQVIVPPAAISPEALAKWEVTNHLLGRIAASLESLANTAQTRPPAVSYISVPAPTDSAIHAAPTPIDHRPPPPVTPAPAPAPAPAPIRPTPVVTQVRTATPAPASPAPSSPPASNGPATAAFLQQVPWEGTPSAAPNFAVAVVRAEAPKPELPKLEAASAPKAPVSAAPPAFSLPSDPIQVFLRGLPWDQHN